MASRLVNLRFWPPPSDAIVTTRIDMFRFRDSNYEKTDANLPLKDCIRVDRWQQKNPRWNSSNFFQPPDFWHSPQKNVAAEKVSCDLKTRAAEKGAEMVKLGALWDSWSCHLSQAGLRSHHVTFLGKKTRMGNFEKKRWTEKNIWIWKLPPVSPAAPLFLDSRPWRQAISLVHIWLKQPSGAHPPEFSRNLKDVGVEFPTTTLQGAPRADRETNGVITTPDPSKWPEINGQNGPCWSPYLWGLYLHL